MSSTRGATTERGQVLVMFAVLLPVFLALAGVVLGVGNWYSHARHLQTKADAGAFAGGSAWSFPCDGATDTIIENEARLYAGANNPQIGRVSNAAVHTVLNGPEYYDNDSNSAPIEWISPPSNPSTPGALCNAKILDVRLTEDNVFPLASLIPLFPDIKRKARIEIRQADSITEDLLPIAVRAPEPVSAAAVFYNESTGLVLDVKHFVKRYGPGTIPVDNLPATLQGWSTENLGDLANSWARFQPASVTGVAIAISFRGACPTWPTVGTPPVMTPPPNVIVQPTGLCFEDGLNPDLNETITDLCNQGSIQIVNCYYATGNYPNEAVQSGLHFIRGYQDGNVGPGAPVLRGAYLESAGCSPATTVANGYFGAHPNNTCSSRLNVEVDIGSVMEDIDPGAGQNIQQTRRPTAVGPLGATIEVRYRLVRSDGSTFCDYGTGCNLKPVGGPNNKYRFATDGSSGNGGAPHMPLTANSRANAIAIQVRVAHSTVAGGPGGCGVTQNFNNNCRWFYTGSQNPFSTSTPPSNAQILASPVQRGFRGNSIYSSSIRWLRLHGDAGCDDPPTALIDGAAASQLTTEDSCFVIDMGLKGGVAQDQDESAILFNDGTGSSQMGSLDCDPNIPQGQVLIDGVIQGCGPDYGIHPFDWSPLCPAQNQIFSGYPTGNPGPPWNDDRWPPIRCVKTRPTGSMNQLERGLDNRFFGQNNGPCPDDTATDYAPGRNYWDQDDNDFKGASYYNGTGTTNNINALFDDPRLVTLFLVPTEAFTGSGQNTYPIAGFIDVYIRGYGRISGNGSLNIDDPCPGAFDALPPDLDLSGGSAGGYAVWGSILNHVHLTGGAIPGPLLCNPTATSTPCVYSLVE